MFKHIVFNITRPLKNYYHLVAAFTASIFYGFPAKKLVIIGITGTDGKTTTASLIYEILKASGKSVGLISSVEALIGEKSYPTGFHVTSPDPWALQKFLREMVGEGCRYVVLEVTSHALDQHRVWGINFSVGVYTNITHDHLDYHQNYEGYLKAKSKLIPLSDKVVLNRDDASFAPLQSLLINSGKARGKDFISYSLKSRAEVTVLNDSPTPLSIKCIDTPITAETSLRGDYNRSNIMAAVGAAYFLDIPPESIALGISAFKGVTGRWQKIDKGQNFTALLDFAHTPNALEKMLISCREQMPALAKLTVVFGCAGLRDVGKRSQMGKIAGESADYVVITAEDPRTESLVRIMEQIAQGCQEAGMAEQGLDRWQDKGYFMIADRHEAIEFALNKLALEADWVVVTGKGHEQSMCFGTTEYPWSDQKVMEGVLLKREGQV